MEGKYMDVENQTTSWDRNVQLRMQSAGTVTRFDISTRYARPRKEANREPILFKHHPRMMMTPPSMKWSQTTKSTKGKYV